MSIYQDRTPPTLAEAIRDEMAATDNVPCKPRPSANRQLRGEQPCARLVTPPTTDN